MENHGYVARLKSEHIEDYIAAHNRIPGEVVELYKRVGIRRVEMFLIEDEVFMYIEADDMAAAQKILDLNTDDKRWNDAVRPFKAQEFREMKHIFRIE